MSCTTPPSTLFSRPSGTDSSPGDSAAAGPHGATFALLLIGAWLVVVAQLAVADWAVTAKTLGDTDDAMRLIEVRAFLAGQGWFDLHEPRLAPPGGYDTHWSRLIDAGLAGIYLPIEPLAGPALAERLMRAVWPALWLLPAIAAVALLARRIAGREAALIALLMVVLGLPAFQQFRLGRIDHHNVQIALALGALAAAAWSDRVRWAAALAGALTGLALAVGMENLLFLLIAAAVPILRFCLTGQGAAALRGWGFALAAVGAAGFFAEVPPDRWGTAACDGMAVNWVVPVALAGLLSALATVLAARGPVVRLAAFAGITALAGGLFVGLEPRCLGGPYAMMDPALKTIWMGKVSEMQSIAATMAHSPSIAAMILPFPLAALLAGAMLARSREVRCNPGFLVAVAALGVSVLIGCVAIKGFGYALWLGIPPMAAAVVWLADRSRLASPAARVCLALPLAPAVFSALTLLAVEALGAAPPKDNPRVARGCFATGSYARLAALPPGLVAGDVDYGAFVLANTPHAALAAPYHRIGDAIIAAHDLLAAPPDRAHEMVVARKMSYLVTCPGSAAPPSAPPSASPPDSPAAEPPAAADGLGARLAAGEVPDWLVPLSAPDEVLQIFQVVGEPAVAERAGKP